MSVLLVVLLVAGGCALCWRTWAASVRSPNSWLTSRLVPSVLMAIGLCGLVLTLSSNLPSRGLMLHGGGLILYGGSATSRAAAWRDALLLQSGALLAASLWLTWRRTQRRPRQADLIPRGQPRWGWLLPPALAMLVLLLDHGLGSAFPVLAVVATVIAVGVAIRFPAAAADLATSALITVGLGGIVFAVNPPPIPQSGALAAAPGMPVGSVFASVSVPLALALLAAVEGTVIMAFGLWLVPRTVGPHVKALLRLEPDAELAGRVEQLTQTRADAVDTAAAELRRVERDLHDGAQARLVALGMNLRAAERLIPTSPQAALALVAEARETSAKALTELRDLIRGVHPPVLADRGLADAVQALALDTPIRTETDIDLPSRLDPPVESACYFAVAEALANAVKHSGARLVQIRIRHKDGLLNIMVTDDGAGGANPAKGSGLAGIERRLGTFDGILAVSSPPGGPTMIVMEVPCALSSPRTYSC
jgi:signal transduction histidine kinase